MDSLATVILPPEGRPDLPQPALGLGVLVLPDEPPLPVVPVLPPLPTLVPPLPRPAIPLPAEPEPLPPVSVRPPEPATMPPPDPVAPPELVTPPDAVTPPEPVTPPEATTPPEPVVPPLLLPPEPVLPPDAVSPPEPTLPPELVEPPEPSPAGSAETQPRAVHTKNAARGARVRDMLVIFGSIGPVVSRWLAPFRRRFSLSAASRSTKISRSGDPRRPGTSSAYIQHATACARVSDP